VDFVLLLVYVLVFIFRVGVVMRLCRYGCLWFCISMLGFNLLVLWLNVCVGLKGLILWALCLGLLRMVVYSSKMVFYNL